MTAPLLDLASRFRLSRRSGGFGGDCPACGYVDAFTARTTREGRTALHCFNGCERDTLHDAARAALGSDWTPPTRPDGDNARAAREGRQGAARRLWRRSIACPGTLAQTYLARRGIGHVATSNTLRFQSDCPHPGGSRCSAVVAAVLDWSGDLVAVHRTFLDRDGRKTALNPPRASLGHLWGGAVRLDPCAPALVVGEGIESAASAGLVLRLPAWAALSAGNLAAGLMLPAAVRRVVIAVDHDAPGQRAAAAAALRWRGEGRMVQLATPDQPGQDFNDLVQARTAVAVPHG